MSMKDFVILSKIGDGAYSEVYKVKRLSDSMQYALKKVKMGNLSQKEKENALNEVRILASINDPSIVAYKEAFFEDNSQCLCLVMEFADDGDLYQKIMKQQKANQLIDEKEIWKVLIETTRALKILHEKKIFHRDLKSANVFMNRTGSSKLGDLNVSKVAKKGLLYTQTGTPYYASPEVWKDQPYDSKSDIWSLGCVIYEMTTLKPPFRAQDMNGLYKRVLKGAYPEVPKKYTKDLADVIMRFLSVEPKLRPSCQQILDMPQVRKRMAKLFPNEQPYQDNNEGLYNIEEETDAEFHKNELLNTIKVPQNLAQLTKRLPKSNYAKRQSQAPNGMAQSSQLRSRGGEVLQSYNGTLNSAAAASGNSRLNKYKQSNGSIISQSGRNAMQGLATMSGGSERRNPAIPQANEPVRGLPQISSMKNIREHEGVLTQKNNKSSATNSLKGGMLVNNVQPTPVQKNNQYNIYAANQVSDAHLKMETPYSPNTIEPQYLEQNQGQSSSKYHLRMKQKNASHSKGQLIQKRSLDGANLAKIRNSNQAIEQFEHEYSQSGVLVGEQRSMSLNSRAQQIVDKQRLQQHDFEKKEIAKRKYLQNQMGAIGGQRDEYGIVSGSNAYGHIAGNRNDSHLSSQTRNQYGKLGGKSPLGVGPSGNLGNSLVNSQQYGSLGVMAGDNHRLNSLPKQSSKVNLAGIGINHPNRPPETIGSPTLQRGPQLNSHQSQSRLINHMNVRERQQMGYGNQVSGAHGGYAAKHVSGQIQPSPMGNRLSQARRQLGGAMGSNHYSPGPPANGQISAIGSLGVKAPVIQTHAPVRVGGNHKPNWWG